MGNPEPDRLQQHPVNMRLLQLAALRDAVYFVETREDLTEINYEDLIAAVARLYTAAGISEQEFTVLVAQSMERWASRFMAVMAEHA